MRRASVLAALLDRSIRLMRTPLLSTKPVAVKVTARLAVLEVVMMLGESPFELLCSAVAGLTWTTAQPEPPASSAKLTGELRRTASARA